MVPVWEPIAAYSWSVLLGGKLGWPEMAAAAPPLHEATQAAHFYQ